MDGEMPRSSEAPVSMFQAPLARGGASPHLGLEGMGGNPGAPLPLAPHGRSWNAGCGFAPRASRYSCQVAAALDAEAAALPVDASAGVVAALAFAAAVVDAATAAAG